MLNLNRRVRRLNSAIQANANELIAAFRPHVGDTTLVQADGTYKLVRNGTDYARFNVVPLPNCGAAGVFCDIWLHHSARNRRLSDAILKFQEKAAAAAGMTLAFATLDRESTMRYAFERQGWTVSRTFHNPDSGVNLLALSKPLAA